MVVSVPYSFTEALQTAQKGSSVIFQNVKIFYVGPEQPHPFRRLLCTNLPFYFLCSGEFDMQEVELPRIISPHKVGRIWNDGWLKLNGTEICSNVAYWEYQDTRLSMMHFYPLSKNLARQHISEYALSQSDVENSFPPMFALCQFEHLDGSRQDSTEIIGIGATTVVSPGRLSRLVYNIKEVGSTGVEPSLAIFKKFLQDNHIDILQAKGHISAKYDIIAASSIKAAQGLPSSSIQMLVISQDLAMPFSSPPLTSMVSFNIHHVCGYIDPENHENTESLRNELNRVALWNELKNSSQPLGEENPFESSKLKYEIDHFISELNSEGCTLSTEETRHLRDHFTTLPQRKDLDFTERLWVFCQGAKDHQDLVEVLTAIAGELETGALTPMVHKTNRSSLANIVRQCITLNKMETATDVNERRNAISSTFDYWIENPFECLVEIGIHKLQKDYCHYLIGGEYVTWPQIEPFIDHSLSLDEQIQNLKLLHSILELWAFVTSNILPLSFECTRELIQTAVEQAKINSPEEYSQKKESRYTLYLPKFSNATSELLKAMTKSHYPNIWMQVLEKKEMEARPFVFLLDGSSKKLLEVQNEKTEDLDIDFMVEEEDTDRLYRVITASAT